MGWFGDLLNKVLPFVPVILDAFKSLAGGMSETKAIDQSSTAEDVDRVLEEFNNYKKMIHQETEKLAKGVQDELMSYIDECLTHLSQHQKVLDKYSIRIGRIERKLKEIGADSKRDLEKEIDENVSFNNGEIRSIIRMSPGNQKQQAMTEFMQKTFEKVLDNYCKKIRSRLTDIYEEIDESIVRTIESVTVETEHIFRKLEDLKNNMDEEGVERLQQESIDLFSKLNVMEKVVTEEK